METNALILLATGRDRPGIVDQISGVIYKTGCNLEDSRMSVLGGEFALIVLVTGERDRLTRLAKDLGEEARALELTLQTKWTQPAPREDPSRPSIPYRLHVVSMDHPGIVHKITHLLSASGINVARLDTRVSHAPVSGTPVFSLELDAQVPADLSVAKLRSDLGALAAAENIDVDLRPAKE